MGIERNDIKPLKQADIKPQSGKGAVAFLFLTMSDLTQPDMWYDWFCKTSDQEKEKINIYLHNKNKMKDTFLENFEMKTKTQTRWGDSSLVIAELLMLQEAVKNPDNQYFVMMSDTTVPLYSFGELYDKMKASMGN